MKKILLAASTLLVVLLASCSTLKTTHEIPATTLVPEVRMNVGLDDLFYVGEATITAESRTYFGFIHKVNTVNGVKFNRRNNASGELYGHALINIPGDLKYAASKVIEDYPYADFFAPVSYKEEVNHMFLGKITKRTMVIKAYKYKVNR